MNGSIVTKCGTMLRAFCGSDLDDDADSNTAPMDFALDSRIGAVQNCMVSLIEQF
jgi:hypothetical protein